MLETLPNVLSRTHTIRQLNEHGAHGTVGMNADDAVPIHVVVSCRVVPCRAYYNVRKQWNNARCCQWWRSMTRINECIPIDTADNPLTGLVGWRVPRLRYSAAVAASGWVCCCRWGSSWLNYLIFPHVSRLRKFYGTFVSILCKHVRFICTFNRKYIGSPFVWDICRFSPKILFCI